MIVAALHIITFAFPTSKGLGGDSLAEALALLSGHQSHELMALTMLVTALEVIASISCLSQLFLIGASSLVCTGLQFSPKVFA